MTELNKYFVPGPTWVRPEILQEMTRPMMGHRSSEFRALCEGIYRDVRELFRTKQRSFVATSSGTGLLEGALLNCVPRRVLVTTCGAFSERWLRIAQNTGVEVDELDFDWGKAVDPEMVATHLTGRRGHYDAVTFTHNETSTGVMNDLEALAEVVHAETKDTLVLVDAVSSLGAAPVLVDEWGIDVCVASTQKGIALPPGLTVFAVSDRALDAARRKHYRGTYFDFLEYQKNADDNSVPFTPSIPHFFALAKQLDHILREETLEVRWNRHAAMRDLTLERTAPYAELMSDREHASVSISALRPTNGNPGAIVKAMKDRGYTLGGGYGQWKDEGFRIGHMGDITVESLGAMLDVLDEVVRP